MRAFVHCSSTLRAAASGSAASALHGRHQRKVLIKDHYGSLPTQFNESTQSILHYKRI
jgi:hypothetical protein